MYNLVIDYNIGWTYSTSSVILPPGISKNTQKTSFELKYSSMLSNILESDPKSKIKLNHTFADAVVSKFSTSRSSLKSLDVSGNVIYGLQGYLGQFNTNSSYYGGANVLNNIDWTYYSYSDCTNMDQNICNSCSTAGKVVIGLLILGFLGVVTSYFMILFSKAFKGGEDVVAVLGLLGLIGSFIFITSAWANWTQNCYQVIQTILPSNSVTSYFIGFNSTVSAWVFIFFISPIFSILYLMSSSESENASVGATWSVLFLVIALPLLVVAMNGWSTSITALQQAGKYIDCISYIF